MKLSKYLADYIKHEHIIINTQELDGVIQQGIEAFESTEGVTLTVLEKGTIRNKITDKRHRI